MEISSSGTNILTALAPLIAMVDASATKVTGLHGCVSACVFPITSPRPQQQQQQHFRCSRTYVTERSKSICPSRVFRFRLGAISCSHVPVYPRPTYPHQFTLLIPRTSPAGADPTKRSIPSQSRSGVPHSGNAPRLRMFGDPAGSVAVRPRQATWQDAGVICVAV